MQKWNPLVASCLGTLMLLIDVTIVNVALPDIAASTRASFSDLQWVMDAYALVLGALVLGMGSVADRYGHKRVFISGTIVFAVASLACGISQNASELIAARAVQGFGGAAMFATTVALLHATYSGKDRGVAFSVWGAVSGAAAGLGSVLGGILTQSAGWRWIFFVNIPVGVLTVAISLVAFAETARRDSRLDFLGIGTFTLTSAALIYALINGGENGWGAPATVIAFVVSGLALVAFFGVESFVSHPMLPLDLLRSPRFSGTLLGAAGQNFAAFASMVLISIWLQSVLHLDPLQTGLALLPLSAVAFVTAATVGRVLHEAAPYWTIGGGLVAVGLGGAAMTVVGADSHWYAVTGGLALVGVGVGVASPALAATAMNSLPPQYAGVASGAANTARQLGFALGIAVLGAVFTATAGFNASDSAGRSTEDFARGLDSVFWVTAGVGVVAGLAAAALLIAGRDRVFHVGAAPVAETDSPAVAAS